MISSTEHLLIVGGNAAGMTAASRAKRLNPSLSVTVLESSRYISYSICGLPYCLGGLVSRFDDLVYFTPESLLNERGIEARVRTRAVEILPSRRSVLVEELTTGRRESLGYDKLLMATGYRPLSPSIEGIEADGVFTASRIEDGQAIADWLGSGRARRAVLIGGGYVSLEMAEALRRRRVEVTLIEKTPAVFPALDADMAALVEGELRANGVRVLTGRPAQRILTRQEGSVEGVELESGSPFIPADMVFVDVGVAPRVELAAAAGIHLGSSGAIAVSERMETNVNSVYAAGNCAETFHLVSGRPVFDPVGTVAAKQGRVAGENMAAGRARFPGAVGTTVVKVFGLTAARTGLSAKEARREGFQVREATISGRFQAPYFEGGASGTVKVVADAVSRRLLGAQIVGDAMAGVRIDVVATALTGGMTVDTAAQLDLAYAPPVGALWNPVLIAMNALLRRLDEG